jgi:hypothetical protein
MLSLIARMYAFVGRVLTNVLGSAILWIVAQILVHLARSV